VVSKVELLCLAAVTLIFAGCAPQQHLPARICPGKSSAQESVATLKTHRDNAVPFRAAGQCLLEYSIEGKKHKENFPVKMWVNPPFELYLQGDVAFDAAGLVFGSNENEFWLWLKPKEISGYWWGRWADAAGSKNLASRAEIILEAFGLADVNGGAWALSGDDSFDILTRRNEQGNIVKRIYISKCEYLVSRIEYLNADGEVAASARFEDYKQVSDGFLVPALIEVTAREKDGSWNSARLKLDSARASQFNDQQRGRLFVRPQPRGFEHIYQVIGDDVVELVQK
jgi:hypothetical protein